MKRELTNIPINDVLDVHPYAEDFLASLGLLVIDKRITLKQYVDELEEDRFEDLGLNRLQVLDQFMLFIEKMSELRGAGTKHVDSVTILGGYNKAGQEEKVRLTLNPGEIICVVGPTGAGKSRLLADIECLAQKDTPTGRQILVNGSVPAQEQRFSAEHKLVAQLSQNMNFVIDLTVGEFIATHAESRMMENPEEIAQSVAECANDLAGEPFTMEWPVTQLSGGQSRALMIADTALLSPLPIVLIDEIENAGVDRKKALGLLVKEEKIVIMSTHDPLLALMGDKRVVVRNGGITEIIRTGNAERANLAELERIDSKITELRNLIRSGGTIDFDIREHFHLDSPAGKHLLKS
jgi:ABC-type lipoprotein export system ATPase subunit